jgi:hypothetical protein
MQIRTTANTWLRAFSFPEQPFILSLTCHAVLAWLRSQQIFFHRLPGDIPSGWLCIRLGAVLLATLTVQVRYRPGYLG